MTIRDRIKAIQQEVGSGNLVPDRAAELLMHATALIGNVADEIRAADQDYAIVLLRYLDSDEAANRAKIRAETSPEYQRKREARDTKEVLVELIRSMRQYLRTLQDEMRLTR